MVAVYLHVKTEFLFGRTATLRKRTVLPTGHYLKLSMDFSDNKSIVIHEVARLPEKTPGNERSTRDRLVNYYTVVGASRCSV